MKGLLLLPLVLAGCVSAMDRAPNVWHDSAEVVCRVPACPHCHGQGHVPCGPCLGSGKVTCTRCKDGTERCSTCDGGGMKGEKKCKTCDGRGRRACSTCGGTRRMACSTCDGLARLHCLRPVQIMDPMPTGEDVWPPGLAAKK